MSTRFGAAAVLAAAWSVPHRCCQALRVACSTAPTTGGRQRRAATTRLTAGFVSSVGRGGLVGAGARVSSSSSRIIASRKWVGHWQSERAAAGSIRMVSDNAPFFTDADAPEVFDGLGPPGPLVDGDKVRHELLSLACVFVCVTLELSSEALSLYIQCKRDRVAVFLVAIYWMSIMCRSITQQARGFGCSRQQSSYQLLL